MFQRGSRIVVGGAEIDVPYGTFSSGQFVQYDAATNTLKGAAASGGGVAGPALSVVGDIATWNNGTGSLLADSLVPITMVTAHASRHLPGGADTMFPGTWTADDRPEWSGSAWVPKLFALREVTTNFTVANTTLADITDLTIAIPRAGTYLLDVMLLVSQATAASTFGCAVNYTGTVTRIGVGGFVPNSATVSANRTQTANNTAMTGSATQAAGVVVPVSMTGSITVSTTGTLSIRAQRSVAATTILAGSSCKVTEA